MTPCKHQWLQQPARPPQTSLFIVCVWGGCSALLSMRMSVRSTNVLFTCGTASQHSGAKKKSTKTTVRYNYQVFIPQCWTIAQTKLCFVHWEYGRSSTVLHICTISVAVYSYTIAWEKPKHGTNKEWESSSLHETTGLGECIRTFLSDCLAVQLTQKTFKSCFSTDRY